MCIAAPAKVVEINREKESLFADFGGVRQEAKINLLPDVEIGDYVLIHAGYAIEKLSEEAAKEQLEKNSEELLYLNSVLINIQNADNYEEIEDIKNELITTEYIRKRKQNKNSKKSKPSKPLHFISSDGIDIYVGKNNIQNDYLYVTSSNVIEAPNDHVLFDRNIKNVYFKDVKTNIVTAKDITSISFLRNIGRIYNLYDLQSDFNKNSWIDSNHWQLDLNNPSSSSSTFK